jgi:hypothetical protein
MVGVVVTPAPILDVTPRRSTHREIQRRGAITSNPILGGLHHRYCRT